MLDKRETSDNCNSLRFTVAVLNNDGNTPELKVRTDAHASCFEASFFRRTNI